MKVGFVFECGPQGADKLVCELLAKIIREDVQSVSRTLDNKPNLLRDAGKVTADLLADGCERVLIVWDLRPAWPVKGEKPCRHIERLAILAALNQAGVIGQDAARVFLVCIEQELESWILADEVCVSSYLSTDAHPYHMDKVKKPDRVQNPKSVMMSHFKAAGKGRYDDKIHAARILASNSPSLKRLRRSDSFARFESKLL